MPPLAVVMWVGDNIQDFPALTQAVLDHGPSALDAFGRTYIMLPNPMYGSWERRPRN
jgi:predicted secreted acid phosphatase